MTTKKFGAKYDDGMHLTSVTATSTDTNVRAEIEGLRLANIGLARRNRELNKNIKDILKHWHKHTGQCPVQRDNWVATICRFILRHT